MTDRFPFQQRAIKRHRATVWTHPDAQIERLAPGQVPLLAVSETALSLWQLRLEPADGEDWVPLGQKADLAWRNANAALHSLPFLWRAVADMAKRPVSAARVVEEALPDRQVVTNANVGQLDGLSFGLSFGLAQACVLLGIPAPTDLAATGTLNRNGTVGPVAEVPAKVQLCVRRASGVRRVLVSHGNFDEAVAAAGPHVHVFAVASLSEALTILDDQVFARFVVGLDDPLERESVLSGLVELALGARGALRDWTSVHRTAAAILAQCPQLTDDERRLVSFAEAVALRHERNGGNLDAPDPDWLDKQPEPRRTEYVAHWVQQAADTGADAAETVRSVALQRLPSPNERHPAHLKLQGALARFEAATGNFHSALNLARETTEAWQERRLYADAVFSACAWLRLAGALEDTASFVAAQRAVRRLESATDVAEPAYLRLAEAQGLLHLGQLTDAIALLRAMVLSGEGLPAHVRLSVARHCVRIVPQGASEHLAAVALLAEDVNPHSDHATRVFAGLSRLDAAVVRQDAADARAQLNALLRIEPQPLGQLLAACPDTTPLAQAAWASRWYPY